MTKKSSAFSSIAIMSIFFLTMAVGAITPAINTIMQAFPTLSVSTIYMVSTLPSLLAIPATLIAGMLAGNKVKYKILASVGIVLFIIGGVAPAFADSFTVILIERAVFGIGIGIISPLGNALVLGTYGDDKRAKMLGIGTVVMNVGGIVMQLLCGAMASISWEYAFYPHLLGILSLVAVIFFLPEPEKMELPEGAEKQKVEVPRIVWLIAVLFGLVTWMFYPVLMGMSTLLSNLNFGNATTAGLVLSCFTLGGMIAGMFFSTVYKLTKRFVIAFALLLMAVGIMLVIYSGSIGLITVGVIMMGMSVSLITPALFMIIGMIASPEAFPMSVSITMAMFSAFAFAYTYESALIQKITGDALMAPMFVAMILTIVGCVAFIFINPFPKPKNLE